MDEGVSSFFNSSTREEREAITAAKVDQFSGPILLLHHLTKWDRVGACPGSYNSIRGGLRPVSWLVRLCFLCRKSHLCGVAAKRGGTEETVGMNLCKQWNMLHLSSFRKSF